MLELVCPAGSLPALKAAIDACQRNPAAYHPQAEWLAALEKVSEGSQTTLGAYHRAW